ncbi:hypothetical protein [Nevskia ramosa]|uniref:hypothetical protein n=1 Tax=Nevskia ramosa TaxID=64002 RepID=UPI002353DF48|nr:hypothetical protein [Nevskia ramosa]
MLEAAAFIEDPGSKAKQLEFEGKAFSIDHEGRKWYPAFQLRDGRPRPVIQALIACFKGHLGERFQGWDLALFLFQPSGHLQGAVPTDILDSRESDKLILMAANAYLGIETDV